MKKIYIKKKLFSMSWLVVLTTTRKLPQKSAGFCNKGFLYWHHRDNSSGSFVLLVFLHVSGFPSNLIGWIFISLPSELISSLHKHIPISFQINYSENSTFFEIPEKLRFYFFENINNIYASSMNFLSNFLFLCSSSSINCHNSQEL